MLHDWVLMFTITEAKVHLGPSGRSRGAPPLFLTNVPAPRPRYTPFTPVDAVKSGGPKISGSALYLAGKRTCRNQHCPLAPMQHGQHHSASALTTDYRHREAKASEEYQESSVSSRHTFSQSKV
ncbi:hypothetical protein SRHO_G00172740 [Serrasalmus rhombeus]